MTHASAGESCILTSKSGSVSCGSLLLSPGSWCAQGFVCALQESVSPVLWKLCNQIPLASKVKFLGGTQSLCLIHRLGNLLWVLELLQQCKNFFHIIVLQFVGHLHSGSMVELMATSSSRIHVTCSASQVCCTQSPCPRNRPVLTHASTGDTQRQVWLSLCGVSRSWCAQGILFQTSECLWGVWGLILNVISLLLPSYWGFSFALG